SRALKGTATFDGGASTPSATLQFDAAGGITLSGTLTGPMTTPPSLLAPDGSTIPVAVLPGKKGAVKLVALKLVGGTGTYVLTIPATAAVTYKLARSPGKLAKVNENSL